MIYRFDNFTLDTELVELRCGAELRPVEPQVFNLLLHLIENRGHVVSKDELIETVWGGRVVSDATLSSRINAARRAVGDSGKDQAIIKTMPRRGFRFVAEVLQDRAVRSSRPVSTLDEKTRSEPSSDVAAEIRERPSVAVLPFDNMSVEPDQEYFADGITEDIITALSKHHWLRVIARNSTFGYKGKTLDVRKIASELGARYVVEGSVRRSGQRLRITAQLIDAATGDHLWAERYDRDLEDIFDLQEEITDTIVGRIEPVLGAAERHRVERKPRTNLQAWDCHHLGMSNFYKFTAAGNLEAQRLLKRSFELDPEFGDSHAWWAYAVILGMVYWDTEPDGSLLDEALAAAKRALSIDDQNAVFYMIMARTALARRDYTSSLAGNETAVRLNPTLAVAHCAMGDALAYEGRFDESICQFEKAIALSPNDPQVWAFLTYGALALIFKEDFETALEWTERASIIPNRQYWTLAHMAVALAYLDRPREAEQCVARLIAEKPDFTCAFAEKKLFFIKRPEQLTLYLDGLRKAGVPV